MNGKELKELLLERGIVLADIARELEITPQSLNDRLRVKSVKTDFLKELAVITGIDFNNMGILENHCYGGDELETITMPREVFDQIAKLTETVVSQQRVIESLSETNKKTTAQMGDNADNADVKGVSGA